MWRVTGGGTWQLAQVEPNGYMGSNGYVGVSWGATDIYTRNGQLSGTGYDSRFVGWLRSHSPTPAGTRLRSKVLRSAFAPCSNPTAWVLVAI